jgi:hypothetical protein
MTARRVHGVILDARDLLLADWLVRQAVTHLQARDAALPAGAAQLRDRLARFASEEPAAVVVPGPRETATRPGEVTVTDCRPAEMTAQAAAGVLGVSVQAARRMCRDGTLFAVRGPAGRWRIDPGSAAAQAARRKDT